MSIDWNDLKYFMAVAQEKSITAASKTLKVNNSTVIRRLDFMEQRLNVTLFVRGKGRYELTEAGNTVFITAKRMSEQALELERQLAGFDDQSVSGNVVISAADFVIAQLLLPGLKSLIDAYPALSLSFVATNELLNITRRDADIVFRLTDNPKLHLPENLFGRRIGHVELCAYKGKKSAVEDLGWVSWDASVDFDGWLASNKYPSFPRRSVINSALIQLEAIKTGDFAAILPCFLGDADNQVTRLKGCKSFKGFEAWVLTHTELKSIKRINITMKYIAEALGQKLSLNKKAQTSE